MREVFSLTWLGPAAGKKIFEWNRGMHIMITNNQPSWRCLLGSGLTFNVVKLKFRVRFVPWGDDWTHCPTTSIRITYQYRCFFIFNIKRNITFKIIYCTSMCQNLFFHIVMNRDLFLVYKIIYDKLPLKWV